MAAGGKPNVGHDFTTRPRKRQHPLPHVFNGDLSCYEDKNNDFLCPVCFETIEEAHMTKCGHTFCFKCITTSLEHNNRCPKCNFIIEKKHQIFPNFVLNELITKHKKKQLEKKIKLESEHASRISDFWELLNKDAERLDLPSVDLMLGMLAQKKQQLETDNKSAQVQLLKEFLVHTRQRKKEQLENIMKELRFVEEDMKVVNETVDIRKSSASIPDSVPDINLFDRSEHPDEIFSRTKKETPSCSTLSRTVPVHTSNENCVSPLVSLKCASSSLQDGFNGSLHSGNSISAVTNLASRRRRMINHFDDLEKCYFNSRSKDSSAGSFLIETPPPSISSMNSVKSPQNGLVEFSDTLHKFTKFCSVRPLSTLNYASDLFNGSSIVSSIEFDKDNEFFAIAGVTKRIKLFEYSSVIQDTVDIHYPMNEMLCNSKISCISWSSYHKGMLANSDYEGSVSLWDAFTGQKVRLFQEHEKRCWSVDFNKVDTKLIASGSDDSRVKLWSTDCEHSVTCLEAKANVCCVKFNPESRYHLAFGSADHFVHYYDLRNTKQALGVYRGHKKAVSYVKFLSSKELVSASTDSQLKLWNVEKPSHCVRSFEGHLNEKNFVGLATDNDYIACGSENNSLYIYYKGLTKQVLAFHFDTVRSVLEKDKKEDDSNEFVSAVCWRTGSNVVVAANSQGTIKVLELV